MNKTFKISYSLKNTYRVNTILYSLKQIPLIKRLLPQELYRDPDFKLLGEILSGIWEFIKAFLGKFLYFLLMVTLAAGLYETAPTGQIFLHIYVLLTLIGAAFGALLGIVLHRFVIVTVEVDAAMFGRQINLSSFCYSALFTCGFSLGVNLLMYFRLKKIDMVESLKSVE